MAGNGYAACDNMAGDEGTIVPYEHTSLLYLCHVVSAMRSEFSLSK
jgi:hypothetical protein